MRVYVDIDDVLAQTTLAACALHEKQNGRRVSLEQVRKFDLEISFGLSPLELQALFDALHSEEILLGLDPMPGAPRALERWERAGFEIFVLTGRPPGTEVGDGPRSEVAS